MQSNTKYTSKTIQNELICLCGEEIVTGIIWKSLILSDTLFLQLVI